jgi:hypothetical protein
LPWRERSAALCRGAATLCLERKLPPGKTMLITKKRLRVTLSWGRGQRAGVRAI